MSENCDFVVPVNILNIYYLSIYYDNPLITLQIRIKSLNREVDSCLRMDGFRIESW